LNSIPRVDGEKTRLKPIKSAASSLQAASKGCPFADRCDLVMDKCFSHVPEYKSFSSTQKSMCFLAEEGGNLDD
jgi:oligopeptide/dipeptide ABC transporter ATP-binding protein